MKQFICTSLLLYLFTTQSLSAFAQLPLPTLSVEAGGKFEGDFAPVIINGKKKQLHRSGVVVDKDVQEDSHGNDCIVRVGNKQGVIDSTGRFIIPANYEAIRYISYGDCLYILSSNGRKGVADSTGRIICEPAYDEIDALNASAVAVSNNNRWGWISRENGKEIIGPRFSRVSKLYQHPDFIVTDANGKQGLLRSNGNVVLEGKYQDINSRECTKDMYVIAYKENGLYGLLDNQGRVLFSPTYSDISFAENNSLLPVQQNGKAGFIDTKGRLVVKPAYTSVKAFVKQRAVVQLNSRYGVIDTTGKLIVPIEYDEIRLLNQDGQHFYNNHYTRNTDSLFIEVKSNRKTGMFTYAGKPLLPISYDQIYFLGLTGKNRCYFLLNSGNRYGLANANGKQVLPVEYESITAFLCSETLSPRSDTAALFFLAAQNQRFGLWNTRGKQLFPPRYTRISGQEFHLIRLDQGDSSALADTTGRMLLPMHQYNNYYIVGPDRLIIPEYGNDGTYSFRLTDLQRKELYTNSKWDHGNGFSSRTIFSSGLLKLKIRDQNNIFVTEAGKEVRFSDYDEVSAFTDGFAIAGKQEKYGIINKEGKAVVPLIYTDIRHFSDDLLMVVGENRKKGLATPNGRLLIPAEYDEISKGYDRFKKYFVLRKDKLYGLADSTGKLILPMEYDDIRTNNSYMLIEVTKGGKDGLANTEGKWLIPPDYDRIRFNYGNYHSKNPWPILAIKQQQGVYYNAGGLLPVQVKSIIE